MPKWSHLQPGALNGGDLYELIYKLSGFESMVYAFNDCIVAPGATWPMWVMEDIIINNKNEKTEEEK